MFICYIIQVVKTKQGMFEHEKAKYSLIKSLLLTITCCVIIILSSDLVVDNAKLLAEYLNLSTKIVTMTVVVIGTSLPEMTMTIVAARKEEFDIALGNIIGTNIFNIGVVLGLPLLVYGGFASYSFNVIDVLAVYVAAFVLYLFARNDKVLSKFEGAIMLTIFVIYYTYIIVV
jgi:cation:H+ antiporter